MRLKLLIETALALAVLFAGVVDGYGQRKPTPTPTPDLIEQIKEEYGLKPPPKPLPRALKPLASKEVVNRVLPSIVLIVAQDENGNVIGQGSGFFYKRGLVATNLHVFQRATKGYVKVVSSGAVAEITEVVAIDISHDICVVRVDDYRTPAVVLNTTVKPSIGDEIYVLSNPKGLEGSVTKGIVSALRKDTGLIQIDAAISPGSSGGAVVDDRAEVIGIAVSSIISGQNLNFAIPSQFLHDLPERFRVPLVVAGSLALNHRTIEKLKGPVREFTERSSLFVLDDRTGKYQEKEAKTIDRKIFDVDGNMIENWEYIDGRLLWKYLNSYDSNGFLTRRIMEYSDGQQKVTEYTFLQALSKRVDDRQFSDTTQTPISSTVFDSNGNQVEMTVRLANGSTQKWVNTFDKRGFLSKQETYVGDKLKSTSRYEYETDDNGNWIKQIQSGFVSEYSQYGFTPVSVIYREIEYF